MVFSTLLTCVDESIAILLGVQFVKAPNIRWDRAGRALTKMVKALMTEEITSGSLYSMCEFESSSSSENLTYLDM